MSSYPPTPNMGLVLPIPGTTEGPEYAQQQTQALRQVDEHDHTLGQGVPITPLALNINDDVSFQGNDAVELRTTTFQAQESTLPDLGALYSNSGDLFWNNAAGVPVPITSGNTIAAGSIGGIGGLNLPPQTAAVNYNPGNETFTFTSAPGAAAVMDHGPVTLRPEADNAHGITIEPDGSIASDWTLTLPGAPPLLTKFLTIGNVGEVSFGDADNTSLQNSSGTLSIKNGGVTRTKQAAVGQHVSGSSGSFSTSNSSIFTSITNQSASLTTSGRPVMLFTQPDSSINVSNYRLSMLPSGSLQGFLQLVVSGSASGVIARYQLGMYAPTTPGGSILNIIYYPPSIFSFLVTVQG